MQGVGFTAGALMILGCCANALAAPDIEILENSLARVLVERPGGLATGSGFILNANGQIATNHHVIAGGSQIAVYFSGTDVLHPARTLWSSAELDLAVIEIEGTRWTAMPLARNLPKKGAPVYALGFPGDADALSKRGVALDASVSGGVLSRVFAGAWNRRELNILQHSADINPGNSGGPLLDACGRVIGVNTMGAAARIADTDGNMQTVPIASGVFWASSVQELAAVLDEQSISYVSDPSGCAGAALASGGDGPSGENQGMRLGTPWIMLVGLLLVAVLSAIVFLSLQVRRQGLRVATVLTQLAGSLTRRQAGPSAALAQKPAGGLALAGFQADGSPLRISLPAANLVARREGFVLGRHPMLVDAVLDSPTISRRHLRFQHKAGKFTVEDLNSANGSQLNGQALKPYRPRRVRQGDRVALGDVELQVSAL